LSNAVLSFSLVAPLLMRDICCFCEDRAKRNEKLEADLSDIILQIVREANERKNHIPPITPTNSTPDSITPFPFKVSLNCPVFAALLLTATFFSSLHTSLRSPRIRSPGEDSSRTLSRQHHQGLPEGAHIFPCTKQPGDFRLFLLFSSTRVLSLLL